MMNRVLRMGRSSYSIMQTQKGTGPLHESQGQTSPHGPHSQLQVTASALGAIRVAPAVASRARTSNSFFRKNTSRGPG